MGRRRARQNKVRSGGQTNLHEQDSLLDDIDQDDEFEEGESDLMPEEIAEEGGVFDDDYEPYGVDDGDDFLPSFLPSRQRGYRGDWD